MSQPMAKLSPQSSVINTAQRRNGGRDYETIRENWEEHKIESNQLVLLLGCLIISNTIIPGEKKYCHRHELIKR